MADLPRQKKDSVSGKKANSVSTPEEESVIARVVSYLKFKVGASKLIFRDPGGKSLGTVGYRIRLDDKLILFSKLNDARAFKRAYKKADNCTAEPVIIRFDTTSEGYIANEREVK